MAIRSSTDDDNDANDDDDDSGHADDVIRRSSRINKTPWVCFCYILLLKCKLIIKIREQLKEGDDNVFV